MILADGCEGVQEIPTLFASIECLQSTIYPSGCHGCGEYSNRAGVSVPVYKLKHPEYLHPIFWIRRRSVEARIVYRRQSREMRGVWVLRREVCGLRAISKALWWKYVMMMRWNVGLWSRIGGWTDRGSEHNFELDFYSSDGITTWFCVKWMKCKVKR